MTIQIKMGRGKRDSEVLVDGASVRHGLCDFDVDLSGERPVVVLKVYPERLEITGELGKVVTLGDLRSRIPRRILKEQFRYALICLFRGIRLAARDLHDLWRMAHPNNREPFPPSF